MSNRKVFLIFVPLFFVGKVALASSIPSETIIGRPGLVHMIGETNLQISGRWPGVPGYEFGYMDGTVFSSVINGGGGKRNLTFQDGAAVDFALRSKDTDVLFKLSDASGNATQIYSDPIKRKGSSTQDQADYSKLIIKWDINNDHMNDLTVLLQSTTCVSGMRFVASTTPVPVPAAVWLLGSGIAGLSVFLRRRKGNYSC